MNKKAIAVILILVLALSLSACSMIFPKQPDGNGSAGGTDTVENSDIDWPLASGVWAANVNGVYELVWMDTENGQNCFSIGIAGSDYYEGGPVSDLKDLGEGVYSFTVNVPKVEANDLNSGHKAYSFSASVDISTLKEVKIRVAYGDDEFRDYYFVAPNIEGFDSSTLYSESGSAPETPDSSGTETAAATWPLIDGVWINGDSGIYYFVTMDIYEGQDCFTLGALFSGYFEGGPISNLHQTMPNVYEFDVNVAAVPENELDSGHDAYTFHVECDLGNKSTGTIYLTIAGNAPEKYVYAADKIEDIDINELYG